MESIKYENILTLKNIPIQWIPFFELYYPDLPHFPMIYVHFSYGKDRVYGFPISISFKEVRGEFCTVDILFLSNKNLSNSQDLKEKTITELENRFGLSDKISIDDVKVCCSKEEKYFPVLNRIFTLLENSFGKHIPFGRYYEEVYSIVRFVAAWQPKTGRQSEMRMLYNFLSIFGEKINIEGKWSFYEFYILPTYNDLLSNNLKNFPKFSDLFDTILKVYNHSFTSIVNIDGTEFSSMHKAWPRDKEQYIKTIGLEFEDQNILNAKERHIIERLIDAFNRHPWRACYFISSIMFAFAKDYKLWDKDFYINFYLSKKFKGVAPKVIGCFLQQGFGNINAIPIDIWIESFAFYVLGFTNNIEGFLNSFSNLGKLERIIWYASQANKTNMKSFYFTQWCTRFGTKGNSQLRESNPIACFECELRTLCTGYGNIENEKVLVVEQKNLDIVKVINRKGEETGNLITKIPNNLAKKITENPMFLCATINNIPKKIFKIYTSNNYLLIDEFSGYLLDSQKIKADEITNIEKIRKVSEFIKELPEFEFK
ncbi:MAG TPA: hypothetical protein VHP32_06700 [Ignavibacteria bacterium]|nr:hypothetical protein [Ignavibacteria bacterium]